MNEIQDRKIVLENMLAVNAAIAAGQDYFTAVGGAEFEVDYYKAAGMYSARNIAQARAAIASLEEAAA